MHGGPFPTSPSAFHLPHLPEVVRQTTAARRRTTAFSCQPHSGDAAFKALADSVFGQVASNKYDAAVASLVGAPRALMIAVENHMDTLEDESFRVVLERQDTLAAQNIRTVFRYEILYPGKELVGVQRFVGAQRDRLHVLIMIVLEPVTM